MRIENIWLFDPDYRAVEVWTPDAIRPIVETSTVTWRLDGRTALILSRSRRHGLREDQPCISFWFHENGMDVFHCFHDAKNQIKVAFNEIRLFPEIDGWLQQLQAKPIN